ncbi:vitamin K epoxide reductase family protein [Streptomyces sp. TRM64462]|uniref:vitamin K epoxide reductase family protein n=1 Tax=Streptomyces sp. TRM64462 TaxID=2741726 RepID=UPI001C2FB188|nr:vitamin K epoxide reductase family protein [Streptomyces sp. TRM64462]
MRRRKPGIRAADARARGGGPGRGSPPAAERVSDDLRLGRGGFLGERRAVAGLVLGASVSYGVVALYQFGLVRRLPEPPLPGVDAERVDATGEAYALLRTPDAAVALASAGITLVLTGAGGRLRHRDHPWLVLLAAGKAVGDAGAAAVLFVEQVAGHRAVCSWCTLAALCHVAAVPPALKEARAALSALGGTR